MRFVPRERLDACVHCGLCLASCPTYLELGMEADSPRGRIQLIRGMEEGRLDPTPEVTRHLDLCLGCRACETACPSGVPYGALIEAARPWVEAARPWPQRVLRRALARLLTTPALRRTAFAPARLVAGAGWLRRAAPRARAFAYAAVLPAPAHSALPPILEPDGPPRGTAVLLTGCVADSLFGATNVATAELLVRAGVRVVVPRGQPCCGALAAHLGLDARARALGRSLAAAVGSIPADWIVSNAAGCGAHLRQLAHLLPDTPDATRVAARVVDALALLAELGLPPAERACERTIAVHDPCHLAHGQGVRGEVRRLLGTLPGVRLVELEESDHCCGSAGTYNLTEPAMAARLLARKLGHVERSGAEVLAAANPGCLLQLRAGAIARRLPVAVEHPIDLLAAAQGVGSGVASGTRAKRIGTRA